MIQQSILAPHFQQNADQFQLDVDIIKTCERPLFQSSGKIIHEVKWNNPRDFPIVLLQLKGTNANEEASFYLRFHNHPNIIRTLGSVRNNSNLVMLLQERAPKADLFEILREHAFKPIEIVLYEIFEQICNAMMFLADNGIVHGDLACRNVLVFESNPTEPRNNLVKITDFGLARDLIIGSSAHSSNTIIPFRYVPPELLQNLNNPNYSEKSDVYSMGVLMWEACSYGQIPYNHIDDDNIVRLKKLDGELLQQPNSCSDQLWASINQCWHRNPNHRPNFQTLKRTLSNRDSSVINRTFNSTACLPQITNNHFDHDNLHGSSPTSSPQYNRPSSQTRRGSGNRSIIDSSDESDDSEREYLSEERLTSFNVSNSIKCPISNKFCQEVFPSSAALHDHLLLCGNKTDQCPSCHQFIRRSHFTYHYENKCAPIDNVETPPTRLRIVPVRRLPPNYNGPVLKEDVPSDHYHENYPDRNPPMHPQRVNVRMQSLPMSNIRHSPTTIECQYCHNRCIQNDYEAHSNKLIYRIGQFTLTMSREPVTEQLPCEHCQQLYTAKQFRSHEIICPENPDNLDSIAELARAQSSPSVFQLIKQKFNRNHLTPSNVRAPENPRAQYQRLDIERTREANRSPDNDRLITHQHLIQRTSSEEILSPSINSPGDVRTDGNNPRQYPHLQHGYGIRSGRQSPLSSIGEKE